MTFQWYGRSRLSGSERQCNAISLPPVRRDAELIDYDVGPRESQRLHHKLIGVHRLCLSPAALGLHDTGLYPWKCIPERTAFCVVYVENE